MRSIEQANLDPETSRCVEVVKNWAANEPRIRRICLFGSRARGDNKPNSDLDLIVLCHLGDFIFEREGWEQDLKARLPSIAIHLVEDQQQDNPGLAKEVASEGILIFSKENP